MPRFWANSAMRARLRSKISRSMTSAGVCNRLRLSSTPTRSAFKGRVCMDRLRKNSVPISALPRAPSTPCLSSQELWPLLPQMKTFYSPVHREHAPKQEFEQGRLAPAVEIPERVERVRARIAERKLGPILAPSAFDDAAISRVHDGEFVSFLAGAHAEWRARYGDDAADAIPSCWPSRGMREARRGDIESRLGTYSSDTATPITKGTWSAARAGVDVALSAAEAVAAGERSAFALTRPPGHHASRDVFGGYCYLNNVAIAAQWLSDRGLRPAILDVDYHHGNGTQEIFYGRSDVLF